MSHSAPSSSAALYVLGLGPGDASLLAPEADRVLKRSSVIAGYSGYISQLSPGYIRQKKIISTGMTAEIDRVQAAVDAVLAGEAVALVCSGDPGVYALAGLVLEVLELRGIAPAELPLHIIPGIPALCAAAALLGAPLTHDFACISLSDLLTPWELIAKRIDCAFAGDFVVVLYNPRSTRRNHQLEDALATAGRYHSLQTPVGIVKNAFRPGQQISILPLADVEHTMADMLTLLIIGNSTSRIIPGTGSTPLAWSSGARMLTPRGYSDKYASALQAVKDFE